MSFSDQELLKAIEENETACFSTFRAMGDQVQVQTTSNATLITTGVNFWLWNPF